MEKQQCQITIQIMSTLILFGKNVYREKECNEHFFSLISLDIVFNKLILILLSIIYAFIKAHTHFFTLKAHINL